MFAGLSCQGVIGVRVGHSLALLALATLLVPALARAGGPARLEPTQVTVALHADHRVFSKPAADAVVVNVVPDRRPLTAERTVLPVLGRTTGRYGVHWLRVLLPGRPNGNSGWIKQRETSISRTSWHIVVHTSSRLVMVYSRGRLIRSVKAVVGKPSTPTPHGEFFVEEDIALPPTAVGAPYALALSARSEVLQEFDGGPGQIALHGLDHVGGTLGTAASHGCVRLADDVMSWLVLRIGPGVPVTVTN